MSDDEDDTHPNIDTPSLFRWRHQARIQRMEEFEKEKEILNKKKADNANQLKQVNQKLKEAKESNQDTGSLEKELKDLQLQEEKIKKEVEEFQKKEKVAQEQVLDMSKFSQFVF